MIGPDRLWEFDGSSEPLVSYKGNSLKTKAKGYRILRFRDGSRIEILYPSYYLRGVLYSSEPRGEILGTCTFVDRRNQLACVVHFGPVKGSVDPLLRRSDALVGYIVKDTSLVDRPLRRRGNSISREEATVSENASRKIGGVLPSPSMHERASQGSPVPSQAETHDGDEEDERNGQGRSACAAGSRPPGNRKCVCPPPHSSDPNAPPSSLASAASPSPPSGTVLGRVTGSWLSHVDWDGKRYWTLETDRPDRWMPMEAEEALPSDVRWVPALPACLLLPCLKTGVAAGSGRTGGC